MHLIYDGKSSVSSLYIPQQLNCEFEVVPARIKGMLTVLSHLNCGAISLIVGQVRLETRQLCWRHQKCAEQKIWPFSVAHLQC